jgi:ribosome-associated protein
MRMADDEDQPEGELSEWAKPSRSSRKRAAEAAQKLGVRLVGLREAQLAAIELPEELRTAVREARHLKHGPALARQHQYIGRLMRDVDLAPIEQALDGPDRPGPRARIR